MVREAALVIGSEIKSDVEEYLLQLEEHRNVCVNEGRYPEAEAVARRMRAVKEEEERRRRAFMHETHVAQRAAAEQNFKIEAREFDTAWEVRVSDHNDRCRSTEEETISRHAFELQEFRTANGGLPFKPKFSPDLLNLRMRQEKLVRQKKYQEAERLRLAADAQEKVELAGQLDEFRFKVALAEEKLLQRQVREMEALQERLARSKNELLRERERELQKLTHRYDATRTALDKQQSLELRQLDKVMRETLARAIVTGRDAGPGAPSAFSFSTLTLNRPTTAPVQKRLTIHEATRTSDAIARQPLAPATLRAQFSAMRLIEEGAENEPSTASIATAAATTPLANAHANPYATPKRAAKAPPPNSRGTRGGSAPSAGGGGRAAALPPPPMGSGAGAPPPPSRAARSALPPYARAVRGGSPGKAVVLPHIIPQGSRLLRPTEAAERRREAMEEARAWKD